MAAKRTETIRPDDRLFQSLIATVGVHGWDHLLLSDIATKADMSLAELHDRIPHRHAIVPWLMGEIDRAVAGAVGPPEPGSSPRDRLFDILMTRFDQLQRLRPLIAAVKARPESRRSDATMRLFDLIAGLAHLPLSLGWMLELAGVSSAGLFGAIRVKGLILVYLATLRVWMNDDTADLSRTMKALDQHLTRAEQWAGRLPG